MSQQQSSSNNNNNKGLVRSTIVEYLTDLQISKELKYHLIKTCKPHTLIVLALHFLMLKHGFHCVGMNETEPPIEVSDTEHILPPKEWLDLNENGNNFNREVFTFKYKHSQRTFTFLLKIINMGPQKVLICATTLLFNKEFTNQMENDQQAKEQIHQMEISNIFNFINLNTLHNLQQSIQNVNDASSIDLLDLFNNLNDLEYQFKVQIQNNLVPKEGYEASSTTTSNTNNNNTGGTATEIPNPVPERIIPNRLIDYDEDYDDYDPLRIRRPPLQQGPPLHPSFGDEDLYPNVGNYPVPRPFRGGGSGGLGGFPGNQVGPNNPIFGGRGVFPGGGRGTGPNTPPGVRFDPIYPNAPFGGRGSGGGRGTGGTGGSGFTGGEPNPNHHRPPRDLDDDDYSHFYM